MSPRCNHSGQVCGARWLTAEFCSTCVAIPGSYHVDSIAIYCDGYRWLNIALHRQHRMRTGNRYASVRDANEECSCYRRKLENQEY